MPFRTPFRKIWFRKIRSVVVWSSFVCLIGFFTVFAVAKPATDPKVPAVVTQNQLLGTWALVGKPDAVGEPKPGAALMFYGEGNWSMTDAHPKNGKVQFHHGGTYTVRGNQYHEKVTFATKPTEQMIGATLRFDLSVDGDTLIKRGNGNPFSQKWKRLKAN